MSKAFLCLALLFSAFMLFVALSGSQGTKPEGLIFWLVIGASSACKLFKSPAKA